MTDPENSDTRGFTYLNPPVRGVEGGYVREDAYGSVGEPDWKATAEFRQKNVEALALMLRAEGDARKEAEELLRDIRTSLGRDYEPFELASAVMMVRTSFESALHLLKAVDRDTHARDLACFDEVAAFLRKVGGR